MGENKTHLISMGGDHYELDVDANLIPSIQRVLIGTTDSDKEIDELSVPQKPKWLFFVVSLLRWYRKKISQHLGNRCVYEPSCSHYSELAFRKYGFFKGATLTINRLYRCRPGTDGIDLS
jgi:putative membrane protein insertion efficiency factor